MDISALINSLHTILKLTYELSDENTSFSFHIIIKGHNKELKHNLVTLYLVTLYLKYFIINLPSNL